MPRLIAPLAPVALILFSGMLYNATASNAPSDAQADAAGVQSLVAANCRPQNPNSRIYDLVGIDTRVAGGIIIKHPERLREVCEVVNRSLMHVSLRELTTTRSMKDVGKERADNTNLLALAKSLSLSAAESTALVRKHGQQVLAARAAEKASGATVVADASPSSSPVNTSLSSPVSVTPAGSGLKSDSRNIGLHYVPSSNFGL